MVRALQRSIFGHGPAVFSRSTSTGRRPRRARSRARVRPTGPAPTMHTSNSKAIRPGLSGWNGRMRGRLRFAQETTRIARQQHVQRIIVQPELLKPPYGIAVLDQERMVAAD